MSASLHRLRRHSVAVWVGLGLAGPVLGGCVASHDMVEVDVTAHGTGTGTVSASLPEGDIECTITAGAASGNCREEFEDAGGGGVFTLTAIPAEGSQFDGFTGCTSTAGTVCTLSFDGGEIEVRFFVGVTFTLLEGPPPAGNTVIYNATSTPVHLLGPGEVPGAGNFVESHGQRYVAIPTSVGSNSTFRAYNVGYVLVASITCQVTAEAWTVTYPNPLVILEGNYLTCSSGLVAP